MRDAECRAREGNEAGADFFHAGLILSAQASANASQRERSRRGARLASACDAPPAAPVDQRAKRRRKGLLFRLRAPKRGLVLMAFCGDFS